jgi:hypothetical protein
MNNSQHEIIKQIISSTTQERSNKNHLPSDKNIVQNYYPVKSMNTHLNTNLEQKRMQSDQRVHMMNNSNPKNNIINKGKIISRSVPRSPLKKREVSQEVDIYKRDSKTGQLVKSGKRIVTIIQNQKRGR